MSIVALVSHRLADSSASFDQSNNRLFKVPLIVMRCTCPSLWALRASFKTEELNQLFDRNDVENAKHKYHHGLIYLFGVGKDNNDIAL